jgi:cytochrome c oxidase subunit II
VTPSAGGRLRAGATVVLAVLALFLAGCGTKQNALAPESPQSRDIANLFWWMFGGAAIGLTLVVVALVAAWLRRNRRGAFGDPSGDVVGWRVVVGLGIAVPIAVLVTLFVISDIFVIQTTQAPAANTTALTIRVIAHQWWWEIEYPGTHAVTANEIHIPVRTRVRLEVQSADVIHSFWVPRLNRKIDTIPGQTNEIVLYADRAGRYRGQCAEFCGLQHAHMGMYVFADPPAVFRRWLATQARPAPASSESAGANVFFDGECATCHTIRGTSAHGNVGPDLTHLASRTSLAALTIPNTPAELRQWLEDPQRVKPGNQMPAGALTRAQLDALVTYLRGLR